METHSSSNAWAGLRWPTRVIPTPGRARRTAHGNPGREFVESPPFRPPQPYCEGKLSGGFQTPERPGGNGQQSGRVAGGEECRLRAMFPRVRRQRSEIDGYSCHREPSTQRDHGTRGILWSLGRLRFHSAEEAENCKRPFLRFFLNRLQFPARLQSAHDGRLTAGDSLFRRVSCGRLAPFPRPAELSSTDTVREPDGCVQLGRERFARGHFCIEVVLPFVIEPLFATCGHAQSPWQLRPLVASAVPTRRSPQRRPVIAPGESTAGEIQPTPCAGCQHENGIDAVATKPTSERTPWNKKIPYG